MLGCDVVQSDTGASLESSHNGNRIKTDIGNIMNIITKLSRCGATSLNLWQLFNEILFNKFPWSERSRLCNLHFMISPAAWHDADIFNFLLIELLTVKCAALMNHYQGRLITITFDSLRHDFQLKASRRSLEQWTIIDFDFIWNFAWQVVETFLCLSTFLSVYKRFQLICKTKYFTFIILILS